MRIFIGFVVIALTAACSPDARAQTTINGADLALKSSGSADGTSWTLDANGYVGTYITLDGEGEVVVGVNVTSRQGAKVNIVTGDETVRFAPMVPQEVVHTFGLPAGTHFIRVEFPNADGERALTIHHVRISGATVSNEHTDANALAAANTYIEHFRQGPAQVTLAGVEPDMPVQVKMKRIAFNFGANIPGWQNVWLTDTPEARRFQEYFLRFFNMAVPSNGGKWEYHESQRGVVTTEWMDTILDFAQRHDLRARMHNLLWDRQQPQWVQELLERAAEGDEQARDDLRQAISDRIQYYVRDRATRYEAIDVLNEAWHRPDYWKAFGAEGVASIYSEVAQAAVDGCNPDVRLCTNEYNVLQWSSRPDAEGGEGEWDPYANWYREQVEQIRDAGGVVTGIGIQYYCAPGPEVPQPHSPARIHAVLQNLSITGLPLEMTEYAGGRGADNARNCQVLEETMRMFFGSPSSVTFLMFGFYGGATAGNAEGSTLVDKNWNLTDMGRRYEQLRAEWSTDITTTVEPDGTINFTGYYGEYEITAGDKTYEFTLSKGQREYQVE